MSTTDIFAFGVAVIGLAVAVALIMVILEVRDLREEVAYQVTLCELIDRKPADDLTHREPLGTVEVVQ